MPSSLPTLEDARGAIAARALRPGVESLDPESALGRVTAAAVRAADPLPGFDNSAMDGYAVRAADTPGVLRLAGEASAGHPPVTALGTGEAMPISTGAVPPEGADAVARTELCDIAGGDRIVVRSAVPVGRDLRRVGEDVAAGGVLVAAGVRIGPVEVGALCAAGVAEVPCLRRPRVAVLVTGDELTPSGVDLPPGGVRDSNKAMLSALARQLGAELVSAESAPDDLDAITAALRGAMEAADLVVMNGGMSVGAHDHVRDACAAAGVAFAVEGVALTPGRPAAYGTGADGTGVLGLPGNPLSALVAFRLLGPAALGSASRSVMVPAAVALPRRPGRTHVIPVRLTGGRATPVGPGGHGPTAAVGADGLALVQPRGDALPAGELVEVALL
jgi:molybdopterin molybdotransferase